MNEDFPSGLPDKNLDDSITKDNTNPAGSKFDKPEIGQPGFDPAGIQDNIKAEDTILDKPEVGKPGIDPASTPDNLKDPIRADDYKDAANKDSEVDFTKYPNVNKDDQSNPKDYQDLRTGTGGWDPTPTSPPAQANAMPLPQEMDPKTPPPIQQMPRQPFINMDEGQQQ